MKNDNPIKGFQVELETVKFIGEDLQRPECILAEPDGSIWAADARGGVVHIKPDGKQTVITQKYDTALNPASDKDRFFQGTLPNGLAFAENGDIYISNFGTDCLEIMKRNGETKVLFDKINGKEIGKVNFVLRDSKNRIWITVSTMIKNWLEAMKPDLYDGYIIRYDSRGIAVVADGLQFTNEIRFDEKEEYLYVVETTGKRITRYKVDSNGDLNNKETYGPSDLGGFPDGIAFDSYGNLWGTLIMADKLFAITPDGELVILLDEGIKEAVEALNKAFYTSSVTQEIMFKTGRGIAPWMSSITFGQADLKTAYIGSLKGTRIPYFKSPAAGLPMVHWKR